MTGTLSPGARLGPYEIVAALGAGGMGEVYRARDPRLSRDVAVKLVPDAFAGDPERMARFEREAKLLASLRHANIAVLHGLEESGGRRFLVMECVEGGSLAQRLERGPLPLPETLEIARAVAAALEAAHENGIVHRDLKPGNVMVTEGGDVKVLDFGLAKGGAASTSSSDTNLSASPTLATHGGTMAGVILGTAAYMSPEQARGKAVDRRADIWSFGCVLYECLTGRQAFAGETVSDIVASILQGQPDWAALPGGTPERLRTLLQRCLEKDARRRLRDIGEARIEIENLIAARDSASGIRAGAPGAPPPASRGVAIALTAVLAAAAAVLATRALMPMPAAEPVRFEVAGPPNLNIVSDAGQLALSPDGRVLAMVVSDSSNTPWIWVRRLDSLTPRLLPGTANVSLLFWSPDSRYLAFFAADQRLSKVAIAGGDPERICDAKAARGGTWNKDGVIVFAPYSNGGLFRVPASGGDPVQVTHPDSAHGETGHRFPQFLPDGRHFVYASVPAGPDGKFGIWLGSLGGGQRRLVARTETGALFCPPHWLLTTRNAAIAAQRFDPGSGKLIGEPITLGDGPNSTRYSGSALFAVSATGTLAMTTRIIVPQKLGWLDLQGHDAGAVPLAPGPNANVTLSPDGHRALLGTLQDDFTIATYLLDLDRGALSRVSQPGENATSAVWSPDGHRVAYLDETTETIVVASLVDGSSHRYLAADRSYKRLEGWASENGRVLYSRLDPATKWDMWSFAPEADTVPRPVVRLPGNDINGKISPDGRWIAFDCDESGTPEVYVAPMGGQGLKYQVTTGGGATVAWSRDGRNLAFVDLRHPGSVMQAEVLPGAEFALGSPSVFAHLPMDITSGDFDRETKRVLALRPAEQAPPQTITVVQNWAAALRKP